MIVTVSDTDSAPQEGLNVYAFNGSTYTGFNGTTNASGEVSFTMPQGDYRFRADLNGTQFWSGAVNHCTLPGCEAASVIVTMPVTVTVLDTDSTPKEGLNVYAFDGDIYTNFSSVTDANGEVEFTLPEGDYRFRADLNGTQFWSGAANHCTLPGCAVASMTVTKTVTVSVSDTDATPKEGLNVYAFDGDIYTNFSSVTDANGEVEFTLPEGDYRFRADLNGTQFWSGAGDHCALPGCEMAYVTVTVPVTVTVASQTGDPYPDLKVYVFDGEDYTGFNGVSDTSGEVDFTLPEGSYRFRADYDGVQFWSGEVNHCTLPGCISGLVEIPGGLGTTEVTIDYTYDPLNRLTDADYDDGTFFHYEYDAVGNRLVQDTLAGTNTYAYDIANRLTNVDGVSYTWGNNGNLLSDGITSYAYNYANKLSGVNQGGVVYEYLYSGLGDRLQQTVDSVPTNYTLDINTGLTQVLADGTNTYHYGQGRIAQEGAATEYFLGDALSSVRQLVDSTAEVNLIQSYEPYGSVLSSVGDGESVFQFTGASRDGSGLTYLQARYFDSSSGRFTQIDPSRIEANLYGYARGNPLLYIDPRGTNAIRCGIGNGINGNEILDAWLFQKGIIVYGNRGYIESISNYFTSNDWSHRAIRDQFTQNTNMALSICGNEKYRPEDRARACSYLVGVGIPVAASTTALALTAHQTIGMVYLMHQVPILIASKFIGAGLEAYATYQIIANNDIEMAANLGSVYATYGYSALADLADDIIRISISAGRFPTTGSQGINMSRERIEHVLDRHSSGGSRARNTSVFFGDEDTIIALIQAGESTTPVLQQRGENYERIVDAGRIIGTDIATGLPITTYSIITNAIGELITAFPGLPLR